MTQTAVNYASALYGLSVPEKAIRESEEAFRAVPQLKEILNSPVRSTQKKYLLIDKIFPEEMRAFLKVLCSHGKMEEIEEIFGVYKKQSDDRQGILEAALYYVTEPDREQAESIRDLLRRRYGKTEVRLTMIHDDSLIGGFIIRTGCVETDQSIKGRLEQLRQKLTWR